ncbi:MAG: cytochrome c oxidase subunit 3 family protein [Acidobacteria bacterium]|nr:cytochrome c oxidase subunit 3 family protein [Acidobacteriota bacterium]
MSTATNTAAAEHGHSKFLQHHFREMSQQFEAAKIGMWLFLVTEVLLFGGLFVGYGIMHAKHPEAFMAAHHHLDKVMGALNTIVLLFSSFTMVMAVWASQTNRRKLTILFLVITLLCACTFMVVKYFEYSHKFHDGLLPGKYYTHKGDTVPGQFMFFSFYFMMTGLHGIHVLLGMMAIIWILFRTIRGDFSSDYYAPVDITGLYWHLVDLIWIYLFPLMYLIS